MKPKFGACAPKKMELSLVKIAICMDETGLGRKIKSSFVGNVRPEMNVRHPRG